VKPDNLNHMINLLKQTYLLNPAGIENELASLWGRYQAILDKPNWEDLNEARAILYTVGDLYCEKIAPEAIERRLHLLKEPMSIVEFMTAVDSQSAQLVSLRKDGLFADLEKFYVAVKTFKNKFNEGRWYLDEDKFIALYNSYNPDKDLEIGERGKFGEEA